MSLLRGPHLLFGYATNKITYSGHLCTFSELTREELRELSVEALQRELLPIIRGYHEPVEHLIHH